MPTLLSWLVPRLVLFLTLRVSDCYVGVPNEMLMCLFDKFEKVEESQLPKHPDTVLVAIQNSAEFTSRFTMKR